MAVTSPAPRLARRGANRGVVKVRAEGASIARAVSSRVPARDPLARRGGGDPRAPISRVVRARVTLAR